MKIKQDIFRQYDIRGKVDKDLTPDTVRMLGQAMGTYFRRNGIKQTAVGRDNRLSSPSFAGSLSEGLMSTGCDVIDLGIIPTPLLYFSIHTKGYSSGVMITGSHNPPEYNGFKMMMGKKTLYGDSIQDIYRLVKNNDFVSSSPGVKSTADITSEYLTYVTGHIKMGPRKIKVAVDAGNGTGGRIAVPVFRQLGCDVTELYCDMDGRFPHHHPDPTVPEALEDLIQTVKTSGLDLGIAYDGDSDRIGVIDEKGQIIWGDKLMILFSRDILPSHPGAAVISEVKASQLLYDEIEKLGGRPIMWKTGHSLIKQKIHEENAILAGEMSGHIFFNDRFFGFDDAIYASARLVELLSGKEAPLSQLLSDLPPMHNTPEIRIYASDQVKFKIVEKVKHKLAEKYPVIDIDGVRAQFPHGWGLVRASNTQEALVVRFEAESEKELNSIRSQVENLIETVIREIEKS
ncbi:MAG: phosphomannomutase/phosphoglucomutase [Candidatus Aminicenantes bacterium]